MNVLLLICFFLSGGSGLIYEVVWTKLLTLAIGSTVYSISTVLVAFMGGLALGSYLGGRFIDRRGNPLLVYGILEGLIGIYCLIIPWLISLTDPLFAVFYNRFYTNQFYLFSLLRFAVCAIILIFPTTLMGATLPVLSRYFVLSREKFGAGVGRLYAINTFGAVAGCFGSGFFLLPWLGQWRTILMAASANLLISAMVVAYWFVKERRVKAHGFDTSDGKRIEAEAFAGNNAASTLMLVVLIAYAANGFAGMVYQLAWTRAMSLSFGSSIYSFSLILTAFILGLAFGSAVASRFVDRLKSPERVFGWVELSIGFVALGAMWGLGQLPSWMVPVMLRFRANFEHLLIIQFALVFAMILLPTFLMGTAFPLAVKIVSMARSGVGRPVGIAYGWNTGGAIAGSFVGGFVLIPLLGLQRTIGVANMVNWVAGIALIAVASGSSERRTTLKRWAPVGAIFGLGVAVSFLMPAWNTRLMDTGPFLYASEIKSRNPDSPQKYWEQIGTQLYYDEGVTTTVSVRKADNGVLFMRVNGKTDASTGGDMATQVLSGHLPLIFQKEPRDVLVIGLASGITAGAVASYPSVKSLDVVEISEGVIEACKRYFGAFNHHVLDDPRVRLITGDGRNHLRETNRLYDAIVSEPSNPWIAGISSLFTREYFQSGRDHLKPGGAMLIWVQGYGMDPESFKAIVRTFSDVFPQVVMWEMGVPLGSDLGLLGFNTPAGPLDCSSLHGHFAERTVAEDLARIGIDTVPRLMSAIIFDPEECRRYAAGARMHTDDRLFIEYEAPRSMHRLTEGENLKSILGASSNPLAGFKEDCLDMNERIETTRLMRARREFLWGIIEATVRTAENRELMIGSFERSYELDNRSIRTKSLLRDELLKRAGDYQKAKDYVAAAADYKRLIGWFPDDGELYYSLGVALYKANSAENLIKAKDYFRQAEAHGYKERKLYAARGLVGYYAAIQPSAAAETRKLLLDDSLADYRRAIEFDQGSVESWNGYGLVLMQLSRFDESRKAFEKVRELKPDDPNIYVNLASLMLEGYHDRDKALDYIDKSIQLSRSAEERAKFESVKSLIIQNSPTP